MRLSKHIPPHVISLAQKICLKSQMKHKLSCIIYNKKGHIINIGYNKWLTIGKRSKVPLKCSIHSEMDAIAGCDRRELYGANIYVYRKGNLLAKPCENCMKELEKYGFRNISWSGELE